MTTKTTCNDCGADEGTLLKEFDSEKNYHWSELAEMTPICASCGSENIEVKKVSGEQ
jgi:Zn finger protein HypA/HybF involved in hydrogenase expression